MKKKRKRNFDEVVRGIASAEKDVDKVLRAAKLTRREKPSFWEDMDLSWAVAYAVLGILGLSMWIGFIVLILNS